MRTFVFIDAANIIYGAKLSGGWKVDFSRLYNYFDNRYSALKIFYYTGHKSNFPKHDLFFEDLTKIGYTVKSKPLKFIKQKPTTFPVRCPKCLNVWTAKYAKPPIGKANCDADLTLDAIIEAPNYDQVIVLSGDGDFLVLYKYLESIGKKVKIISESRMTAREIKQHFQSQFSDLLSIKEIIKQK